MVTTQMCVLNYFKKSVGKNQKTVRLENKLLKNMRLKAMITMKGPPSWTEDAVNLENATEI